MIGLEWIFIKQFIDKPTATWWYREIFMVLTHTIIDGVLKVRVRVKVSFTNGKALLHDSNSFDFTLLNAFGICIRLERHIQMHFHYPNRN